MFFKGQNKGPFVFGNRHDGQAVSFMDYTNIFFLLVTISRLGYGATLHQEEYLMISAFVQVAQ